MTARDIIAQRLTSHEAVVAELTEVLREMDAQEESLPVEPPLEVEPERQSRKPKPKRKPGPKPSVEPADRSGREEPPANGWTPTNSQRAHAVKITQTLNLAGKALSPAEIAQKAGIGTSTVFRILALFGTEAPDGKKWFAQPSRGLYESTGHAAREVVSGE